MKKAIKFLTLLIFAFALVGCVKPEIYTVTFDTNTDAKIEAVNV